MVTLVCALTISAQTEVKTTFGSATGSVKVDGTAVTWTDSFDNDWKIETVTNSSSFTQNSAYSQIGAAKKPATSITATTTFPTDKNITITKVEAKFGGFSGTKGDISIKLGADVVATGSLSATTDVTVTNAQDLSINPAGKTLTVSVTNIDKGVKLYYISYTYVESGVVVDPAPEVSFPEKVYTVNLGETFDAPKVTTNSTGAVTYTSSDEAVAMVDAATGAVELKGEGNTTITATVAAVEGSFKEGTASYQLTVVDPNATSGEVTIDFTKQGYTNGAEVPTVTEKGVTATFADGGNSIAPKYYTTGTAVRMYSNNSMTISVAEDYHITEIIVSGTDKSNPVTNLTTNLATYSSGTWTPGTGVVANSVVFTNTSTGQARIQSVIVKYEKNGEVPPVKVEAPTFSVAAGWVVEGTQVELSCATEGAHIYYTTNDEEPTAESAPYVDAIVIDADMTVKAIAINGEDKSDVSTAEYKIYPANSEKTPLTVAQADALITAGFVNSIEVYLTGTVTEVTEISEKFKNATYVISDGAVSTADETSVATIKVFRGKLLGDATYIQDDLKVGDVVVLKGKLQDYNGENQVSQGSQALTINGSTTAVENIVADDNTPAKYYNLQGVEVAKPEQGLYIRVQGKTATKIYVK